METINKLLSFIPDKELEDFAIDTGVNKSTKKLHGQLLFKLLFYCMVTEKDNSLRGLQSALESAVFRTVSGIAGELTVSHSSISERLNVISVDFFEKIFQYCVTAYKNTATELNKDIVRFDSTIISMSTKLMDIGYNLKGGDAENYRLLKFTIGYSDMPDCVCFYKDQTYNSENRALTETILANQKTTTQLNVFDRGITARDNYDKFTDKNISFISRINPGAKHKIHLANSITKAIKTDTLTIISDSWVYLFTMYEKRSKYPVRLIEAVRKDNNEKMIFITNRGDIENTEVAAIYKSRWDIEVFFKFIKQHLDFSHLLNRTENGIKVMMYVTMIVAILLTAYKKLRKLTGYKIPKRKFAQELENDILYNFVLLCNGDPAIAKRLIYPNSS
jgi:Transposase DDE domain